MRYFLLLLTIFASSFLLAVDVERDFHTIWQTHIEKVHPKEQLWLRGLEKEKVSLKKFLQDSKKVKESFEKLTLFAPYFDRSKEVGQHSNNQHKNRYFKGAPYDDCRTLRHLKDFYISASDVITQEQYYIITHAPMENTIQDFWKMVVETKAPLIVQLMSHSEGSNRKYPRYLPTLDQPKKLDSHTVSLLSQEVLAKSRTNEKDQLIKSSLRIRKKQTKEKRKTEKSDHDLLVTHLHYVNWPDGGVPQNDLFQSLLTTINELGISKNLPIVVHCVAGVGRSGLFALAHTSSKLLQNRPKNPHYLILKNLLAMRMQRRGLLSRKSQFEFVLKSLIK